MKRSHFHHLHSGLAPNCLNLKLVGIARLAIYASSRAPPAGSLDANAHHTDIKRLQNLQPHLSVVAQQQFDVASIFQQYF